MAGGSYPSVEHCVSWSCVSGVRGVCVASDGDGRGSG